METLFHSKKQKLNQIKLKKNSIVLKFPICPLSRVIKETNRDNEQHGISWIVNEPRLACPGRRVPNMIQYEYSYNSAAKEKRKI